MSGVDVFIWVGKGASRAEKINSMKYAVQYLNDTNRGPETPITRILEGQRNVVFDGLISYA